MKRQKRAAVQAVGFLAAVLFLLPVIWTVVCSFVSEEQIEECFGGLFQAGVPWRFLSPGDFFHAFSWGQYRSVLILSPDYLIRFWRSVWLTVPTVIFQTAVSCPAAFGFSRSRSRWIGVLFFFYLVLMMLPYQVTVIPNYLAARQMSLTDTPWSIWLPGIFSPFSVYLLTRYMRRIPANLFEAAQLDGAGEAALFWHVALPICRGEIAACVILIFIDYWNMVELPLVMFTKALSYPLSVYLSKIQEGEVGISFAAAVIYMIPVFLVYLYGAEELTESIAASKGVKG